MVGRWSDILAIGETELLEAIAALHAAAGTVELWPEAFDKISDVMGASAMLIGGLPHSAGQFDFAGHRIDPEIVDRINGPLATRDANPLFGAIPRAPVLRPVIASSVVEERRLKKSRVYADGMHPADVRYCITTVLASDAECSYALVFGRDASRGDFDCEDARRFAAIAPHVLGAVHSQQRLAVLRGEASVLDMLDRGVVAIDSHGRVLFMNREAERILSEGDGLRIARGAIEATGYAEQVKLQAALNASLRIPQSGHALVIDRPSGLPAYSAIVTGFPAVIDPLPHLERHPHRVVFLRDPIQQCAPRRDWLMQLYGLTHAEAEVAMDLHAGMAPGSIAAHRSITANTVKTHMKSVFAKVGVGRQSELVAAIALSVGDLRFGSM